MCLRTTDPSFTALFDHTRVVDVQEVTRNGRRYFPPYDQGNSQLQQMNPGWKLIRWAETAEMAEKRQFLSPFLPITRIAGLDDDHAERTEMGIV